MTDCAFGLILGVDLTLLALCVFIGLKYEIVYPYVILSAFNLAIFFGAQFAELGNRMTKDDDRKRWEQMRE